ncbi:MAG: thymidylate kinase [Candidatus Moraniibacteriota bacterium]
MPKKGRLIVIDGADGSGKATQTRLLVERLKKEGRKVVTFDFPRYEDNFFGQLIGECITGEHGDFVHLDPYVASTLYACDRMETRPKIEEALKKGKVVVLDRYVSSNQLHQAGKVKNLPARKKFLGWLDEMEHEIFKLPRPDSIFYLDVPQWVSARLLREQIAKDKKTYLKKGGKDTVEADARYLALARESALKLLKEQKSWQRIVCTDSHGNLHSPELIAKEIWQSISKII